MERNSSEIELPGFRFHPTEEELLNFYLRRAAVGKKFNFDIIATVNLYLYDPWDLPAMAKMGEREWYFFVPRDRRQGSGGRPNRTTERGFWKATGSDRHIRSSTDPRRLIGLKKTLVYYGGRAPRGTKTDWIMNEYRLPDASNSFGSVSPMPKEDIVLCKVYRKATPLRELEQRAAMEEESRAYMADTSSNSSGHETLQNFTADKFTEEMKEEQEVPVDAGEVSSLPELTMKIPEPATGRQLPSLPELQVPSHGSFDWSQDPFINQLRSPWLEQWSPLYAQMLNF
ncbi:NAC domain-containing protein 35-like [Phalaenopsis equestris]|uniref:NAC domain-containing protein 35-like n=1 Tax=Phalaenopsis equestris TaxID=78828 RepID=UPI0009E5B691|nr:NAC domain-containing protein 35-like [Phalaenopsis equestris]